MLVRGPRQFTLKVVCLLTIDPGIADDPVRDQAVPDEEDRNRAERRRDEAGALIGPIPANGLTNPG